VATDNVKIIIEVEDKASPTLASVRNATDSLETAFRALASAYMVKEAFNFINAIETLDNRLRLVTTSTGDLNAKYGQLFDVAQATRQGIAPTIELYSKLALTTGELGINTDQLMKITEAFGKSLIVSGASTQAAAAATYQFAQAMGSGRLQGDEFRSMVENNPKFMDILRQTTGLTTLELRKLASDGFLSTAIVAQSLQDGLSDLNDEFDKMPKTVGNSLTSLQNAFQATVRDFLEFSSAGTLIGDVLGVVERNIKPLLAAVIALGAAFAIGATIRVVVFALEGYAIACAAATAATRLLTAAINLSPWGRVASIVGVMAAAVGLVGDTSEDTTKSTDKLSNTTEELSKATKKQTDVSDDMNKMLEESGALAKLNTTAFDKYLDGIKDQIKYGGLFSNNRKDMIDIDKALQKTVDDGRKNGITYTQSQLDNMRQEAQGVIARRDIILKTTGELESRYKDYISFIKSNQDKALSDQESFDQQVKRFTDDRLTYTKEQEESTAGYLDALRAKYSEKYQKLIQDEKTANMSAERKFQVDLQQLEDDSRNSRLSKDINFEAAKAALRAKYMAEDLKLQADAKAKLMTDQEKFDAAMMDAQTKLNIGLYANQSEYQAQVDALKINYTQKYRDLEKSAQEASMSDTQKYTEALKKIEDDFLAGRFSSYEQYTKAKENTEIIHNKKLWDEAEKYRIEEGGAFAAYQQKLSQLQADNLAGRFKNEEQYQTLVREATKKLNDDVASTYSTMYNTVSTKLLEMLGVNKEKWPMMKEVIKLFGIDSDAILKDLFKQAIYYLLGFTNPGTQNITTLGGVITKVFGSGGSANKDVGLFTSSAGSLFSGFGSSVVSIFSNIGSSLSGVFRNLYSFLSNDVLGAIGNVISQAARAASSVMNIGGGSSSTVSSILSAGLSYVTGGLSNIVSGILKWFAAKGGVMDGGQRITKYATGGVVGSPTLFPMQNGLGLMGEAGAEAILPLTRTANGDLGVKAQGAGGGPVSINFTINAVDSKGIETMLMNNKALITNIVRSGVQQRGVMI
jgi:tape measure domain-containing protein